MASSALEAVKSFVKTYNLTHKTEYCNYAAFSKMLLYLGADFWLRHHENQEMTALALYFQKSSKAKVWDRKEAMYLAFALSDQLLQGNA